MDSSKKTAISIFGSCVSRDVFRLVPWEGIELKTYIARQSLQSAISAPWPLGREEIKLESAFQRAMVWHDLCKDTFAVLARDGSSWLIIDLIDERFQLKCRGDSILTVSTEVRKSGALKKLGGENCSRLALGKDYYLGNKLVADDVKIFADRLREIYQESHIIIHQAYFTKCYFDRLGAVRPFSEDKQQEADRLNKLLKYMYHGLELALPKAAVINPGPRYLGSETHQWGLATCHYEDGYYAEVMEQLKEIIMSCVSH